MKEDNKMLGTISMEEKMRGNSKETNRSSWDALLWARTAGKILATTFGALLFAEGIADREWMEVFQPGTKLFSAEPEVEEVPTEESPFGIAEASY